MENKYYTPNYEDLNHYTDIEVDYFNGNNWIGFKNYKAEDFYCGGYSEAYHYEDLEYICSGKSKQYKIRVKYLDKEDIESLGFIRDFSTTSEILKASCDVYTNEELNISLAHYLKLNKISIITRDFSKSKLLLKTNWDDKQVNLITIKNKTELVKLLKQLEIYE